MASTSKIVLLSGNKAAVVADEKGAKHTLPTKSKNFIFQAVVSNHAFGDVTILVEDSVDGVNWDTLITFTASKAADGHERKDPATSVGGYLRTSITTTVGGDASVDLDVAVNCWYSPTK